MISTRLSSARAGAAREAAQSRGIGKSLGIRKLMGRSFVWRVGGILTQDWARGESISAETWSTDVMAAGATIYSFDIDLADADRSVYETLALRVARHPSESPEYLLTRVLAYALEFEEGIAFSTGGLSEPEE